MKTTKPDTAYHWYLQHRRENFAASQRLEGVTHPVARKGDAVKLPSRAELLKKYRTAASV